MNKQEAAKVVVGETLFQLQPGSTDAYIRFVVKEIVTKSDDPQDELPLFRAGTGEQITYLLLHKGEDVRTPLTPEPRGPRRRR